MKRIAIVVCVAILALRALLLAQIQTDSAEKELIKLETEFGGTLAKRDVESIARLLADDFMGTESDSLVLTKAQFLETVKPHEYSSPVSDEWNVRIYGDAAVVMRRYIFRVPSEGKEVTGQERFTDTWIIREGRWQCVAMHASKITRNRVSSEIRNADGEWLKTVQAKDIIGIPPIL